MIGMDRTTGAELADTAHIAQSIGDILTTPIGTRVMRRDYGSMIPDLIDRPMHRATLLQLYAAVVLALARWEPRVRVERIQVKEAGFDGSLTLRMAIILLASGERSNIEVPL